MLAERQRLTTNPLTVSEGVNLQVDDVYVPLGLEERKKQSKRQDDDFIEQGSEFTSDRERKQRPKPWSDVLEHASELYRDTEIKRTFEQDEFLVEVLKQKNTPNSKGERIAIIGEPGAGKTTLLQRIADWGYENIQDSIVIWVSLVDLRGEELESYLFNTWLKNVADRYNQAEDSKELTRSFKSLFNDGKVLLLLDGLDEMSVSRGNPITEIAWQINKREIIKKARIFLTCRVNLWDGSSFNRLDNFDIFRTLKFSYPDQVETFIHKWFLSIPEPNEASGKRLCQSLMQQDKAGIKDLVRNPLCLTLLCRTWLSKEGNLPNTQAGLYQLFVNDLYTWTQDQFTEQIDKRKILNKKLGKLAKEALEKENNPFVLSQYLVNRSLMIGNDDSLLKLAKKLGWLNQVGIYNNDSEPVYAFFHTSFQEFFAAQVIEDWDFFLPRKHKNKPVKNKKYRIFEPQWKQTILFWLGRADNKLRKQKQQFMNALVNFKDGCGKCPLFIGKSFYEYRAYFLAAEGIAEFRDYSRSDEILEKIIIWYIKKIFIPNRMVVSDGDWILNYQENLLFPENIDLINLIVSLLQPLQSQNTDKETRISEALNVKEISRKNKKFIAALGQLLKYQVVDSATLMQLPVWIHLVPELEDSKLINDELISRTAKILVSIGKSKETGIKEKIVLKQSQQVRFVSKYLIESSETIHNDDDIIQDLSLSASVKYNQDIYRATVGNPKQIYHNDDPEIHALVQQLHFQYMNVTWLDYGSLDNTLRRLEEIGTGSEIAIRGLVKILQLPYPLDKQRLESQHRMGWTTSYWTSFIYADNFSSIIRSLGNIGINNQIAINALIKLLQSEELDYETRKLAAGKLGIIGKNNQTAIIALIQQLLSQKFDDDTRYLAAFCLSIIGKRNQIAIDALVKLLESHDVDQYTHELAVDSLGKIGKGDNKEINALVQILRSPNTTYNTRGLVIQSLGLIGKNNQTAINSLAEILQLSDEWTEISIESLEKIGRNNQTAINALLKIMKSEDINFYIRRQAAWSLGKIAIGNEIAIKTLLQLLKSQNVYDYYNRSLAERTLPLIATNNNHRLEAIKFLSSWLLDSQLYKFIWECAQDTPYPDFYLAWHQSNFWIRVKRTLPITQTNLFFLLYIFTRAEVLDEELRQTNLIRILLIYIYIFRRYPDSRNGLW
ncbi:MAG: HEAT repeat domain-containing protein [Nostoc sp. TH1S01]|nr:HEAT repeat domain-containing protein [Nostoc sp. TH1S01]